jgi:hypothetical protein
MVYEEKDWAFIALCDAGSLWLYHGSWSRIKSISKTTDLQRNRLVEAEPLYQQVLRIFAKFRHCTGHEHPHFHTAINNYADPLSAMGLSEDAIAGRVRSAIECEPHDSA